MPMTGQTLRSIRQQIEWSRDELGRVLGISPGAVEVMELGAESVDGLIRDAVRRLCVLTYDELDELLVQRLPGEQR